MSRQLLMGGGGTAFAGGVLEIKYLPLASGWPSIPASIPTTVAMVCPTSGKFSELRIVRTATPGGSSRITYSVFIVGVSGCIVRLESGDLSGVSTTEIAVSPGQGPALRRNLGGASPTSAFEHWSVKFTPDIADETILFANGAFDLLSSVTEYVGFSGVTSDFTTTEFDHEIVIPTAGTFKKMYGALSADPGSGKSRTFTLVKNSSDTSLAFTISDFDQTGNNTADTVSVVAGDSVVLKCTSSGTPDSAGFRAGIVFVPTTPNLFIVPSSNAAVYSTTADRYGFIVYGRRDWQTTEADRLVLSYPSLDAVTFKNMYVLLSGIASGGSTRKITLTLRKDGADTTLALTMSGGTTSGNVTADVAMSDDALWGIEAHPTLFLGGGPNARRSQISFAAEMIVFIPPTSRFMMSGRFSQVTA